MIGITDVLVASAQHKRDQSLRRPTRHFVKCWPRFFDLVLRSMKRIDYRVNDRDYEPGDTIINCEYYPTDPGPRGLIPPCYTGRCVQSIILQVWESIPGMPEDYCILELSQPTLVYYTDPSELLRTENDDL